MQGKANGEHNETVSGKRWMKRGKMSEGGRDGITRESKKGGKGEKKDEQ